MTGGGWFGDGVWSVLVILGPIVLGVAIFWAMRHNKTSKRQLDRTEQATHDLYDREARDQRDHDSR